MPIVNSVYKGKQLFTSEFICPHCLVTRRYSINPRSERITLSSVPFLESSEPTHVVECQDCKHAFDPEVLRRSSQILCKLAGSTRNQLDQGTAPGYLKLQLVSDGLRESLVDQLLTFALH